MFWNRAKGKPSEPKSPKPPVEKPAPAVEVCRFPKPKVLLVDMGDEAAKVLRDAGYNTTNGTFGRPYKVQKSDTYNPVFAQASLPNYTEQEIVIIDLQRKEAIALPDGKDLGSPDWWASCSSGAIDPRPRIMQVARPSFDRIVSHGGVFVIFAHGRDVQEVYLGSPYSRGRRIYADNWGFLSILDQENLSISADYGEEIRVIEPTWLISKLLQKYVATAMFECIFKPQYALSKLWTPLAVSKYGDVVAGVIRLERIKGRPSFIYILPPITSEGDRAALLKELLQSAMPNASPWLFPYAEGNRWVEREEYELPEVIAFKERIEAIQKAADADISKLREAISEKRTSSGFLHDLVRASDRTLVLAIKKTLEMIGFRSVIDVDEEAETKGTAGQKREDLQIRDGTPILLAECKGIAALPKDEDALAVQKYVVIRMKEWNRTDVQGLSIINHQRNLPCLEREHANVFRTEIVTNAQEQKFGLLTTWDLFRIARSYVKNGWKHESIRHLLYQTGRIDPVPAHYQYVGVIHEFWEKAGALSVKIDGAALGAGDRIAYDLPTEFEEETADSLQIDGRTVSAAPNGAEVGIKTRLTKDEARKGVRVFRIAAG